MAKRLRTRCGRSTRRPFSGWERGLRRLNWIPISLNLGCCLAKRPKPRLVSEHCMVKLHKLQLDFVEAVLARNDQAIAAQLSVPGGTPESRLGIYRSNTYTNLRGALRDVYPVILRLVGDDFFDHAANAFI